MWRKCISIAALTGGLFCLNSAHAALLYQWGFDPSTPGTPTVTAGGGNLGVFNSANGHVAFGTTGPFVGAGVLDATSGQTYGTSDPSGYVATTATGGSAITGLPDQGSGAGTMKQMTVTFWMKGTSAADFNTANFPRLFILGAAGTTDNANNSFAMEMRSAANGTAGLDILANNQGTSSSNTQGGALVANQWYFIAVSYDGSSAGAFASSLQQAAAGDSHNAQLYEGTDTAPVTRYGVGAAANATPFTNSAGPVALGTNAALILANRSSSSNTTRGFNGLIDDFRIYDTLLTPSDVEAIRVADGGLVPEPASLGLIGLSGLAMVRRRKH